jgi:hypothetical protein
MRTSLSLLVLCLAASALTAQTPDKDTLSEAQIRELFKQVADQDLKNHKAARDYTYTERQEEHRLDGNGRVKSTESKTFEVMELYGSQTRRLVAKNDKPLSGDDARKEEERIRKIRAGHQDRREERREEDRKFVREVADAYNFTLVDVTAMDGRPTYVIDAVPRPGYQPHMKDARMLPKFRFRAWVDKDDREWKKLDIQCIDTVSFGLILARLHKGSRIVVEQTLVNDEVWLPQHVSVRVDARVALLKEFNIAADVTYRDYKKFRTDSKITPAGEVSEPH